MEFRVVYVSSTSVTIEMINNDCYISDEKYDVLLNNELVKENCELNVTSLFNLTPNTEYEIKVLNNSDEYKKTIRTKYEFVKLNVREFGAVGDGVTDDTIAIQAAIMACPKDGRVYIPSGDYYVETIVFKSNMTLELAKGATLYGNTDRNVYPILPGLIESTDETEEYHLGTWEGNPLPTFASIITGINVENVSIIGEGTINGNGSKSDWWVNHKIKRIAWRPKTIFLNNCKNITLQGVKVMDSPSWTIHPYYTDHINIYDVFIENEKISPNTDGINPESCSNVEIIGVKLSVGDDCIVIKSGKIYMGKYHYKPSEKILIRNCKMEFGHGSVVLGSEIAGGVKDISLSQCLFSDTDRGLRIKTRRGRGDKCVVDNIFFENIIMDEVRAPFTVNMHYRCDPDGDTEYVWSEDVLPIDDRTPYIGKMHFKDIKVTKCHWAAGYFVGLPEQPIKEVKLENVEIDYAQDAEIGEPIMTTYSEKSSKKGIYAKCVNKLVLHNVKISGQTGDEVITEKVGLVDID